MEQFDDIRFEWIGTDRFNELGADLEQALRASFAGSQFNEPHNTVDNVVWECLFMPPARPEDGIVHLLAIADKEEACSGIVGGIFDLPTINALGLDSADSGWFFAVPWLSCGLRHKVVNHLWHLAFEKIRQAGYGAFRTTIGTASGTRYLQSVQGLMPTKEKDSSGRTIWYKPLS